MLEAETEESKLQLRFGEMPLFVNNKWQTVNVFSKEVQLTLKERINCLYGWYITEEKPVPEHLEKEIRKAVDELHKKYYMMPGHEATDCENDLSELYKKYAN